ncbi:hypothetical protein FRACYDRAFT_239437 [Fragilariopsis cylindrus CCMP1102]|uniref:Uncharacterized protein n=1 Tax=Fragilariopsis cylindrus CCMP1102 TaxID=635003 RepID=A0A1E7FFC7_9STRA|nr:hypothetical protein FRACYDRAFT_239437 [Fragilariopsis cylindrus CCMP1102]|eukprot:OEU16844.1 hypothetical protein FRACYDRAFT_239437 [Fragilariopsis cylindrus CCMP1102]
MAVTRSKYLGSEGDIKLSVVGCNTLNLWFSYLDGKNKDTEGKIQIPDGVTRDDVFRELEQRRRTIPQQNNDKIDLVDEWISFMVDDELDLVLSTSSLTAGSDFTFNDKHGKRESSGSTNNSPIKFLPEANGGIPKGNISYAQLFFDPETQTLVTLMEMNFGLGYDEKGNEKHRNGVSHHHQSFSDIYDSNERRTEDLKSNDVSDVRLQDQTLLTECSSISSETRSNDDCGFDITDLKHFPTSKKSCFLDEPIVFSHEDSMNRVCWFEENDYDMYLLHDCDDPWGDYNSSKGARCTDTLKKLLTASRSCISLPQVGELKELKWKDNNGFSKGNYKANSERLSYSVLKA